MPARSVRGARHQPRDRRALLGLAVGDAVGTTLEFTRRDAQPPIHGSYDDVVAPRRAYPAEGMTVRGPVFPTRGWIAYGQIRLFPSR